MTKKELEEFVVECTKDGMDEMVETHGSFRQRALVVDLTGNAHWIVIADTILHGPKMAALLAGYVEKLGGADTIIIQSDARVKVTRDKAEVERIEAMARQNKFIIADDPENQEVFVTFGRSREHTVACSMAYSREESADGDKIHFHHSEPVLADGSQRTSMIPNVWERVN